MGKLLKRLLVTAIVFQLIFLFSVSCYAKTKIRVAYIVDVNLTPFFVALNKGYFKKAGLDVEAKEFISGRDSYTALKAKDVDIHTNMGANAVAKFYTQGIGIIMIRAWTLPHFKILCRKDAPFKSLKDLIGKNYAVTSYAGTTFALSAMAFNALGIDFMKKVNIKTVPPSVMRVQLDKGALDAVMLWQPHVYKMIKTGKYRALADPGKIYQDVFKKRFFHGALGCQKAFFDKHRKAVRKYVDAIDKGIKFALEHPKEANKIQASYMKGYTADDIAAIRKSWGDGWIRKDINEKQIEEMQFMYDQMVKYTKYFKVKPVAKELMINP